MDAGAGFAVAVGEGVFTKREGEISTAIVSFSVVACLVED